MNTLLVTGGAGFIGSCFAIQEIQRGNHVIVLDSQSYASNLDNLSEIADHPHFTFVKGDIADSDLVSKLCEDHNPNYIVNFAAETHVDNSINGPQIFIETNILGTYHLLQTAKEYYEKSKPSDFKFLHVSTDEVFGQLPLKGTDKFSEKTAYDPSSPYSASKASSDHLVRAWHHTYGLPIIITNCSNNYGPRQHHEKLIPHMIKCALSDKPLPVYGAGENVRDWIYVEDHTQGISLALEKGKIGSSYCFGGNCEKQNIELVRTICKVLDRVKPRPDAKSYEEQITFVTDRLGHDLRYAIDDTKARSELGYTSHIDFEQSLTQAIEWYLEHETRLS
jgi:dTDP-glucose 4,6-dehydratase